MGDISDYYRNHSEEYIQQLKETEHVHVTKNGDEIPVSLLEDSHLINIINYINRRSKEGVTIRSGGGTDPDDFWYDEKVYYGKQAKRLLKYQVYKKEAKRRNLTIC